MNKYKKVLIILFVSFIIYFISSYINNNFIEKNKYDYVYILKDNYNKNEEINIDKLDKILVNNEYSLNYIKGEITGYLNDKYNKNTILCEEMLSNEIIELKEDDKEYTSIFIDSIENSMSNKIKKGSIVNIYYTSKFFDVSEILNKYNKNYILSNQTDLADVTINLFENIRIVNVYDKEGNNVNKNSLISTIVIEVTKEEALIINSLRNKGTFSVNIIR